MLCVVFSSINSLPSVVSGTVRLAVGIQIICYCFFITLPHVSPLRTVCRTVSELPVLLNTSCRAVPRLSLSRQRVIERSHMSGEFFNLYLHQNYLDFFSDLEDVVRASEYLSDADFLTAEWSVSSYKISLAAQNIWLLVAKCYGLLLCKIIIFNYWELIIRYTPIQTTDGAVILLILQ